jgi:Peptidase family M28
MGDHEQHAPRFLAPGATIAAALVAFLGLAAMRLPAPAPLDAPDEVFSARRAERHVAALSTAPRTLGSAAHAAAAEYVLAELGRLGLETEEQETTWLRRPLGETQVAARVRNLIGRWPGDAGADADTLLLLAHYDSQPQTWGAADDASGVAVVLETLRALAATPRRNEVLAVITDAEEVGLIGAEAFVGEHPAFARVDLTLNFEARGNGGPAIMFEASDGSLGRVRELARLAPYPIADSLSYEVYRRMPNDTDFSVIRRAGGRGLNFAFVEGHPAYHSRLDTAAGLDLRTLQQEGTAALALARRYAGEPIPEAGRESGVYFNPFGSRLLWVYSAGAARALAGLLLALLATAAWRGRAGDVRLGRAALAAGLLLPAAALAMGTTWLARRGIAVVFPDATASPHGIPYDQAAATLGYVALAVGSWLVCLRWWRGSRGELLLGVSTAWALLALGSTGLALGASHLFLWPALLLTVGTLTAGSLPRRAAGWWVPALAVLPAVAWWARTLELSYVSLTVHAAVVLAVAATLAASLLTPAWHGASRGVAVVAVLSLLVFGLGALTFVAARSPGTARPRVDSLFVLQDAISGNATWRSLDPAVDAWTARAMGPSPERRELPPVLDPRGREYLTSPARPVAAEPPTVEVESDERPSGGAVARRAVLRLRPGSATSLRIWVRAEVALQTAALDGRSLQVDDRGELRLSVHGVPPEGVALEIEMADRWPLKVDVVGVSYGLPEGTPKRPVELIPRPGWWTDTTMLWSAHTL